MTEKQVSTEQVRARARYARRRLELGWGPSGRAVVREGPDVLVSMVEIGALARALELVELAAAVPDGLDGDAAVGWRAGAAAAVSALRAAVEHQAGGLPSAPSPVHPSAEEPSGWAGARRSMGVDWCPAS